MTEPEVPDEAYIAAAIADRGFEVDRSSSGFDAEVRFVQPQPGYSSRGGVSVLTERARVFAPPGKQEAHEHDRPDDHSPTAELSADPGPGDAERCNTEAELKPKARKKQNRPKS